MKLNNHGRTIIAILTIIQTVFFSGNLNSQETFNKKEKMNTELFIFKIKISEKFVLGSEIPFTVSLFSKKGQEIYPLNTAAVKFVLKRFNKGKQKTDEYEANIGGNTIVVEKIMANGTRIVKSKFVKRKKVMLNAEKETERVLDLSTVFARRRFSPGNYTLFGIYENQIETKVASFKIVVDEKKTVPSLINLIKKGNLETKIWARNTLFAISGYPDWSPKKKDSAEEIKKKISDLRLWWQENKSKITLKTDGF